jgi:hypothetical protein
MLAANSLHRLPPDSGDGYLVTPHSPALVRQIVVLFSGSQYKV